jgi:hypothetical protein
VRIPLISASLHDRSLNPDKGIKDQPEGYIHIVDLIEEIELDKEKKYAGFDTIILDSATKMCEHLKRLLIWARTQGKFGKTKGKDLEVAGDMNWPAWGSYLSNLEEFFTPFTQINKNIICTVHLSTETEHDKITDTDTILGYWPMIDGQMKKKLAMYFDEVYFMEPAYVRKEGEMIYRMRTAGPKHCARTSLNLPELVDADLEKILHI